MRAADILLFSTILAADRITKAIIPRLMDLYQSITVVPGFFNITYVRNSGGAFGILAGWNSPFRRFFFILASIAALGLLIYLYRQAVRTATGYFRLAIVLIAAGAFGNLYDRAVTGEVVDFLDFFVGIHHYPAFNVADSAITVGGFLLAYLYLTGRTDESVELGESGAP
jgi:signal peptidase II